MKKLFTSTLLTVAAVPFLMAAPSTAKKAQNTTAPAKKVQKKHVKKSKTKAAKPATEAAANKK